VVADSLIRGPAARQAIWLQIPRDLRKITEERRPGLLRYCSRDTSVQQGDVIIPIRRASPGPQGGLPHGRGETKQDVPLLCGHVERCGLQEVAYNWEEEHLRFAYPYLRAASKERAAGLHASPKRLTGLGSEALAQRYSLLSVLTPALFGRLPAVLVFRQLRLCFVQSGPRCLMEFEGCLPSTTIIREEK
jgi:hypothetical protein